ncbi:MAG TPA: hypothetical protein VGK48_24965 [Terriglobia bacterium]|jgi:hypothetical protein
MLAQILISILLASMPVTVQSEQAAANPPLIPAPQTRLEMFAAQSGALLASESYSLARISGGDACSVRLQVVIMYQVGREAEKLEGLRLDMSGVPHPVTSYIDFDELGTLSQSINAMLDINQKGTSFTNPSSKELFFSSRGGLKISMVQTDTEKEMTITHTYSGSSCTIKRDTSVVELKGALDKVLQDLR